MTKGFEDDVGTKTSFYGFTVNTMKNSLISYWKLGFTSVPQGQVRPLMGATVPRAPPPRGEPQGSQGVESLCQNLGHTMGLRRRRVALFQAAPHNSGLECEWLIFSESL